MKDTVGALMKLAEQSRVVRFDDLRRGAGLTYDQLRTCREGGLVRPIGGGAYFIGPGTPSNEDELVAATIAATPVGGTAVISHRSAGVHWAMRGVVAVRPEVTVLGPSRTRVNGVVIHRSDSIAEQDLVRSGRLLITSPPKTLCDLGAVLAPNAVERAFEDAYFRNIVTFSAVREANQRNRGRGRRGTGVLATILDARDPLLKPPESELELRLSRLLRRAGLEPEETQKQLVAPDGTRLRVDYAWTSRKKGVEANGRVWHSGREDLERNDRKMRALALLGWTVMPVGYVDVVHRPDELLRDIRRFIFGQ